MIWDDDWDYDADPSDIWAQWDREDVTREREWLREIDADDLDELRQVLDVPDMPDLPELLNDTTATTDSPEEEA